MRHRRAWRRLLGGAALVGVGLVFAMPQVQAQTASPKWTGSKVTTPPSSASPNVAITAEWHHDGKVAVNTWLTTPAGLPIGCADAGEAKLVTSPPSTDSAQKVTTSSASTSIPCNGTYSYRLDGQVPNFLGPPDDLPLSGSIDIVVAPDPVTGVTASPAGETSVALSWTPASSPAPDFLGYQVERQGSNGQWTKITSVGADAHSYSDTSAPTSGGPINYRVLARRSGPHGELLSDDSGHASATLPTTTTSSTAPPGTTPGSTPGSTPGTGGTGGTGGAAGGVKTPAPKGPLNKGTTGIGVTAPSLGSGTTTFPSIPGEADPGAGDGSAPLPYPGSNDGLGGGTSEGSGVSAFYQPGSGRGMAVPVATGFVLAAWAFHLRFLARAARPAKVTAPRGRRFS